MNLDHTSLEHCTRVSLLWKSIINNPLTWIKMCLKLNMREDIAKQWTELLKGIEDWTLRRKVMRHLKRMHRKELYWRTVPGPRNPLDQKLRHPFHIFFTKNDIPLMRKYLKKFGPSILKDQEHSFLHNAARQGKPAVISLLAKYTNDWEVESGGTKPIDWVIRNLPSLYAYQYNVLDDLEKYTKYIIAKCESSLRIIKIMRNQATVTEDEDQTKQEKGRLTPLTRFSITLMLRESSYSTLAGKQQGETIKNPETWLQMYERAGLQKDYLEEWRKLIKFDQRLTSRITQYLQEYTKSVSWLYEGGFHPLMVSYSQKDMELMKSYLMNVRSQTIFEDIQKRFPGLNYIKLAIQEQRMDALELFAQFTDTNVITEKQYENYRKIIARHLLNTEGTYTLSKMDLSHQIEQVRQILKKFKKSLRMLQILNQFPRMN